MKRKFTTILPWIITALVIAATFVPQLRAQTQTFTLYPGDSLTFDILCNLAPTVTPTATPTMEVPTGTPTPTSTPVPVPSNTPTPLPTNTPVPPSPSPSPSPTPISPTSLIYAITRTDPDDWQTIASLGVNTVDYLVSPGDSDNEILSYFNVAHELGLHIILNIWDSSQVLKKPWFLDSSGWHITSRGQEILDLVRGHPALWSIYALHEPLDSGDMHVSVDDQKTLYTLLKLETGALVFTDIGGLDVWASRGEPLGDGMMDIAGTFKHRFIVGWDSQQCYDEILSKVDADLATRDAMMPNTQIVFQIQAYADYDHSPPQRLPTEIELAYVRDYLCAAGEPVSFYPWKPRSSYDITLVQAPALWPVIAGGCNGVAPTPEPTATGTPTAAPTNTPTPTPTSTPASGGGVIIDHTYADTVPDLAFLNGKEAVFSGKSWRDRIMPQVDNYTSSVDGVNAGDCSYDYPCKIANFKNQIQSYWAGVVKPCYSDMFYVTDPQALAQYYIDEMDTISQEIVLTTIVLTSAAYGRSEENAKSQIYNDHLRAHCLSTPGCVLWDIADIISDGGACSEDGYQVLCPYYDEGDYKHPNTTGANRLARGLLWAFSTID